MVDCIDGLVSGFEYALANDLVNDLANDLVNDLANVVSGVDCWRRCGLAGAITSTVCYFGENAPLYCAPY